MDKKQKFLRNNGFQTVLASLICIIIGFIIGFVVLLIISPAGAGKAITAILKTFSIIRMPQRRRNILERR